MRAAAMLGWLFEHPGPVLAGLVVWTAAASAVAWGLGQTIALREAREVPRG